VGGANLKQRLAGAISLAVRHPAHHMERDCLPIPDLVFGGLKPPNRSKKGSQNGKHEFRLHVSSQLDSQFAL
jgi:hypothetical protein